MPPTILVTGGAGFIGSNFLNLFVPAYPECRFVCADKLTYAGNLLSLELLRALPNFRFERCDLADFAAVERLFAAGVPDVVFHFAAESHVDRSLVGPADFIQANILGTFNLLEACRKHWLGAQGVGKGRGQGAEEPLPVPGEMPGVGRQVAASGDCPPPTPHRCHTMRSAPCALHSDPRPATHDLPAESAGSTTHDPRPTTHDLPAESAGSTTAAPPVCPPGFRRFHHVSTDEVFGSLGADGKFSESTAYDPSSPYSASKAASDHLVRAYHRSYGLPVTLTNCSNNYGPRQFPEKLIPLMILNAVEGRPLPVYGKGANVRDWLYVDDHCQAVWEVAFRGRIGETYNIGGNCELRNLEVVEMICDLVSEECRDRAILHSAFRVPRSLITFVADRPGHDFRYAMDTAKIQAELGWRPEETFASGLRKTVCWYLDNPAWVESVRTGEYRRWMEGNYVGRGSWVVGRGSWGVGVENGTGG